MKQLIVCCVALAFSLFLVYFPANADITTSLVNTGEDIQWSIDTIPDNQIQFTRYDAQTSTHFYRAPLRPGQQITVRTEIPSAQALTETASQRGLEVSIPDNGTRWVAKKEWLESEDGFPSPTSVTLDHRAFYKPYQRVPPYPDNYQLDKWIYIRDYTFAPFSNGFLDESIVILPEELIGVPNSEDNGLPKHAKTDPDYSTKKPFGCNGCSEIGLPGYRVNMKTLRPVIQDLLFAWEGLGPSIQLALTWNVKQGSASTNFGNGWSFSYDSWLSEAYNGVVVKQDDGGELHFEIPFAANSYVHSTATANGETVVVLEHPEMFDVPSYTAGWDGKYVADRAGYRLEKILNGNPSLRSFVLTPPDKKWSYIYEGPSGSGGALPLVAIEDWNGNRVQITRNASGAITQITDAVNRSATLSYNASGQCTTLTIPGGQQLHFNYSGSELSRSVDLISNQTDYSYEAGHLVTSMTTEGRAWQFSWTESNFTSHLISVTAPGGKVTQYAIKQPLYEYKQTEVTDPSGRVVSYHYPYGEYVSDSHPQSYGITSDSNDRPVEVYKKGTTTNPRRLEYDTDGNLTKVTEFDNGVHTYTYNAQGQITQYVDALDKTWKREYDIFGNETRRESPVGRVQQKDFNPKGQLVRSIDPMGNSTQWTYNAFGKVQTSTDVMGAVTTFGYDSNGFDVTSITNPLGHITSFTYDANRRKIRTTHPDGTYKETLYDCCAAIGVRNENGDVRTVTRSPSQEILTESDYLGNTVSNTYDAAGKQVKTVNAAGQTTTISYNDYGQASSVQDALGNIVSWQYATGNLYSYALSQEPLALVPSRVDWRGVPYLIDNVENRRDKMGRLHTVMPLHDYGRIVEFERDDDGLLTEKSTNVYGTITSLASYARDLNGALSSLTHSLGTDSYVRNARGQVTRQTWYDNLRADFAYNNDSGRLATLNYPDGSLATYSYDSKGRITTVVWKGQTLQTQYDGVGNILQETRSNGITTTVTSNKNSMPVRINHHSTTETLFDLQCSRNALGSLTSCSKTGTTGTWLPALTAENTATQYKYDHSFTIDKLRGLTATTDVSGNQTTIPGPRNFSGTYDFQNLLTTWTTNSGSNAVVYDGKNRIIQWTRGGAVRRFHYDSQDRLLFETDGANSITAMWLYRGKKIVAMADSNGVYYYHNDLSANVTFLSDDSGNIVATYRYLPFGLQVGSVSTVQNPFTFVGSYGVLDLREGLYYMRSRTYDSMTHAFLSNDPLGIGMTSNAREYANNNPVSWIDPDGLSSCQSGYSLDGVAESNQFSADHVGEPYVKKPYYSRRNPLQRGNKSFGIAKCYVETGNFVVGTVRKSKAASVLLIQRKLNQGQYVDAAFDGVGLANPVAGVVLTFSKASKMGNGELPAGERQELLKCNYYNKKETVDFGEFTLPEFSLPEFTLDF